MQIICYKKKTAKSLKKKQINANKKKEKTNCKSINLVYLTEKNK